MAESLERHFEGILDQVRLARDVGFDLVAAGQHYLAPPFQALQPLPALSRIIPESGSMRIASAVVLLPLQHPVDLAEQAATLDVMSGGRLVLGVALGYREVEYRSFGLQRRDRLPRFTESLELMKRLWTEESVTYHGTHFRVDDVSMAIHPIQRPYPPIWVGGNTDGMVRRAARLGFPWLANPHSHIDTLARQLELYRNGAREHAHQIDDYPIMLEMYPAKDRRVAMEIAGPYLEAKYQAYTEWGQDKVMGPESFPSTINELAPGRYILGSPEECVEQIRIYEERLGVNWMILRIQWPGMDNTHALSAIELLGKHILPAFSGGSSDEVPVGSPVVESSGGSRPLA